MHYRIWFILIAGILFSASSLGYVLVKIFLRPKDDVDDYYWEVEERHPGLKRYNFWSRVFFVGVLVSMVLLMLVISI